MFIFCFSEPKLTNGYPKDQQHIGIYFHMIIVMLILDNSMILFILTTRILKKKILLINIFTINEYQSKQYSNFLLRPRINPRTGNVRDEWN